MGEGPFPPHSVLCHPCHLLGWLLIPWLCVRLTFLFGAVGGENWDSVAQISIKALFPLTAPKRLLKMFEECWISSFPVLCALFVTKFERGELLMGFEEIPLEM